MKSNMIAINDKAIEKGLSALKLIKESAKAWPDNKVKIYGTDNVAHLLVFDEEAE